MNLYRVTYINKAGILLQTAPMPLEEAVSEGWQWNDRPGSFISLDLVA